MKRIFMGSIIALLLSFQSVSAESLQMPNNSSSISVEIPSRGMTMSGVEEHFGEPEAKKEAIGEPPITVWQYSNYTVYFEYKNVIHTVVDKG